MDFSISFHDGVIAACTLVSPFLAVYAQSEIERRRAKRGRKKALFEALMTTRGETLSVEYKRAVNMIELVFHDDLKVIDAWHNLFDSYVQQATDDVPTSVVLGEKRTEALKNLLMEMAAVCGYKFDERTISKGYYAPQAHGTFENEMNRLRGGLLKIVEGGANLRIEQIASDEVIKAQGDFQKRVADSQDRLLQNQERLLGAVTQDGYLKVKVEQPA